LRLSRRLRERPLLRRSDRGAADAPLPQAPNLRRRPGVPPSTNKPTLATALAVATLLVSAGPAAARMARADYCADGAVHIVDGTSNTLQIGE